MPKKLIAIPEGNLMRVAKLKGHDTLSALKEKTSVDRKTLRAIDAGQQVKETTLQSIANRLRVPLAHLVGATPADGHEVSDDGYHCREIALQRLDAIRLRRMAAENTKITWLLKIDQISEEVEALLLRLEKSLEGWLGHQVEMGAFSPAEQTNLIEQIARVKTSVDIDGLVEELARRKLNIYGATYVYWSKDEPGRDLIDDYQSAHGPMDVDPLLVGIDVMDVLMDEIKSNPTLRYNSRHTAALCIAPEGKGVSTIQIATGYEPPQEFDGNKLTGIDFVKVDGRVVWSRKKPEIEIPF